MKTVLLVSALLLTACASAPPGLSRDQAAAIVASSDRTAADRKNDERRKPTELLAFIAPRKGMTALDVSASGGYTTELVARAVGPTGKVIGQSLVPAAGPQAPPPPAFVERTKNPQLAHMQYVRRPFEDPVPPELKGKLDLVTFMFNYHDMGHLKVDRDKLNRSVFEGLKPGGIFIVADHSGRAGTGISESGTLHRVEEAFVVKEVEAAGFKLAARGDFLRNPQDPRDQAEPAHPKDEFVLKFVKP
ncbi:class I SAM-dependent methyltransferase [Ramlibacter sp. PS4R-6]|uniref:class I SAM-dependent methyltransferase n=1 Tax=Ramlibacter sp. PS4R-6 TaxID=3133438 RepID=UPI0030A0E857